MGSSHARLVPLPRLQHWKNPYRNREVSLFSASKMFCCVICHILSRELYVGCHKAVLQLTALHDVTSLVNNAGPVLVDIVFSGLQTRFPKPPQNLLNLRVLGSELLGSAQLYFVSLQ